MTAALARRQVGVPVVVGVLVARRADARRVGRGVERRRLQVAPRQRAGRAPGVLGDVEAERARVGGPLVVPHLEARTRGQVRHGPVVAGQVEAAEVVDDRRAGAQGAVRDEPGHPARAVGAQRREPVVEGVGPALVDRRRAGRVLGLDGAVLVQAVLPAQVGTAARHHQRAVGLGGAGGQHGHRHGCQRHDGGGYGGESESDRSLTRSDHGCPFHLGMARRAGGHPATASLLWGGQTPHCRGSAHAIRNVNRGFPGAQVTAVRCGFCPGRG